MAKFADATKGNEEALKWFQQNDLAIFIILSKKIQAYKKRKEDDLSDYHKIQF
jgi:hypothetical protein